VTQTLRFHRQSAAPERADVASIMDSALSLYASRLGVDRVEIRRDYVQSDRLVCFKDELRHAFANLVGNALDAIAYLGTVRVRIRAGQRWGAEMERGIYVLVGDSGTGIPEVMRRQLFQPFVSTKDQTGTGLGLWATQNIVRKHHGQVRYRTSTRSGRHGTVFSLFLPYDGVRLQADEAEGAGRAGA
jgi:signal transduction histidine kinase